MDESIADNPEECGGGDGEINDPEECGRGDGGGREIITGGSNLEHQPCIGMQFDSEEEAFTFYNKYARITGFSVRVGYRNISKTDRSLLNRMFLCSKQGVRGPDKRDCNVKNHRAETRTNCLANMYISFDKGLEKFVVTKFNETHNHLLHLPQTAYMMPSQRRMCEAQAADIDIAKNVGIPLKASYDLMSAQAGGRENLGFTRLDQKNYLRTRRQRNLKYGEAGSLMSYFETQAAKDPSFYSAYQFDNEEYITNFFWADHQMIIDYSHFGDVISFDTTFRTNKEYRPLACFVGFNHFRETIVFGAALMYDETAASFAWLFKTFLKAMSMKSPISIFTDQDPAMAKAIAEVLPDTYHGLCTWHMYQNALKHLANTFKTMPTFGRDFNKCIYGYEEEHEFITAWEKLLDDYHLRDNKWMLAKWPIREKWAHVYMKRTFTAGMRTTQLSESFNSTLRKYFQPDDNIAEFFVHYENLVNDKRCKEWEAVYHTTDKLPNLLDKEAPMLKQAGEVYTPIILKLFQSELTTSSLRLVVRNVQEMGGEHHYVISLYGQEREYYVCGHPIEHTVSCSCRKFEVEGILCSHALKVLDRLNIMEIPERYILQRWRKDVRGSYTQMSSVIVNEEDPKLVRATRYRQLCPILVHLAARCSENEDAHQFVSNAISDLSKQVENILIDGRVASCGTESNVEEQRKGEDIIEPNLVGIKGLKKKESGYKGRKRLTACTEKGKSKKKTSQPSQLSQPEKDMTNQSKNYSDIHCPQQLHVESHGTSHQSHNISNMHMPLSDQSQGISEIMPMLPPMLHNAHNSFMNGLNYFYPHLVSQSSTMSAESLYYDFLGTYTEPPPTS